MSLRTVQRLLARLAQRGDDGIAPDYHRWGQQQAQATDPQLVQHLCQTRRQHPRWGSERIRLELEASYPRLPSARTLRRQLHSAGLQPAPAGRSPAAA